MTCLAPSIPETVSDIFDDSDVKYATLIVPEAKLQSYKMTSPWSDFGTIKSIESTGVKNVEKNDDAKNKVIKRMQNGKIIIEDGGKIYDAAGKKVM